MLCSALVDAGVIQRLAALALALVTLSALTFAIAFVRLSVVSLGAFEFAVACLAAVVALARERRTVSVRALSAALADLAALAFATGYREQFCVRVLETGPIAGVGAALLLLEVPDHGRVLLRANGV